MSLPTRRCNIVFQGGGVRGAAYAGALDAMPPHVEIVSVAGTSAGAIVAAFVAKGYRGAELKKILADPALTYLLSAADVERWKRVEESFKVGLPVFKALVEHGISPARIYRLRGWHKHHKRSLGDLAQIWQERGIHNSSLLREWLDKHLGNLTFDEVRGLKHVQSLRIVASDLSGRRFRVFGQTERDGGVRVAKAVHASASIPVFFTPLCDDNDTLVDGGMLSNFPSFLFARSEYPTIGFRLVDLLPPGPIVSTFDFLHSLLHTMMEAHDQLRGLPDYFRSFEIEVPADIPATKFNLTPIDLSRLYDKGLALGRAIPWDACTAPSKIIPYWDPKPQQALQLSITEANKLFERYTDRAYWVDKLVHKATFTARIKLDWSVEYDRLGTIEVFGTRSLIMARSTVVEPSSLKEVSISEIVHTCVEVTPLGETELIHIPAENATGRKGFLLFYVPPISAGSPRTFRTGFEVRHELAESVHLDKSASLSYGVRQIANEHVLDLTFRILIDVDLPKLSIMPEFPGVFTQSGAEFDIRDGRTYYIHQCFIPARVDYNAIFTAAVKKAAHS